jgi:hypothetical protein
MAAVSGTSWLIVSQATRLVGHYRVVTENFDMCGCNFAHSLTTDHFEGATLATEGSAETCRRLTYSTA